MPDTNVRVLKTYRGRPGCGCGCRGTYSVRPATMTRRLRGAAEALAAGAEYSVHAAEWNGVDPGIVIAVESEKRYLWIYVASWDDAAEFFV